MRRENSEREKKNEKEKKKKEEKPERGIERKKRENDFLMRKEREI